MSTSKSYHRVLFNNLSSILFWSNLKLLLLQHYSIHILICFLFCLITHGTLVLLNYTNFFGSAVTHLCHKHDDIICYHTLLPSEGWISDHVTHPSLLHTTAGAHTAILAHHITKYIQMNMKDFRAKRLLQIPEQLQSSPTTVRMNLFVWQTKGKNTVKRWIGKRLPQCNLETENRDLTK